MQQDIPPGPHQESSMTSNYVREFDPMNHPAFPNGLPNIELEVIKLSELEAGNQATKNLLFDICKTSGIFFLDLSKSKAVNLASQSEEIARLSESIFRLTMAEKLKYIPERTPDNRLFGYAVNIYYFLTNSSRYKHAGKTITDRVGTPDTAEFFNIAKNDIIKVMPDTPWPQVIHAQKSLLTEFVLRAHETGLAILSALAQKLHLPPNTLTELHRLSAESGDHIRMIRGPPRMSKDLVEIQTPGHTDFGTVTVMFNWLGGLQVWSEPDRGRSGFVNVIDPEKEKGHWLWVIPKPDHAIVCLGDAAVKLTNGLLCSARHRVIPAPGMQGEIPRYAVVYFVRPEDRAMLKSLESPGIIEPSEQGEEGIETRDWIAKQLKTLSERA